MPRAKPRIIPGTVVPEELAETEGHSHLLLLFLMSRLVDLRLRRAAVDPQNTLPLSSSLRASVISVVHLVFITRIV